MWNNLSLKEKAELIQAGVKAGYRDIDSIRKRFNSFSKGNYQEPIIQRTQEQLPVENVENSDYSVVPKLDYYKDPNKQQVNRFDKGGNYTVGNLVDAIYQNNSKEEHLGRPSHLDDLTQSEEWANAHGYYPDAKGHRDDRVKKPAHPSHPSRGNWQGDNFILTEKGFEDPNYTLFGLNDGGQDPQATLIYNDGVVLPEITVTPNSKYINNSYDNIRLHLKSNGGKINRFDGGGFTLHTGNDGVDTALSFVPFYGTGMDIENAIKDPTLGNIGMAALGLLTDLTGLTLAKGLAKSIRAASKASKAADKLKDAEKAYNKAVRNQVKYGNNKKRGEMSKKAFQELKDAEQKFLQTHKRTNRRKALDRTRRIRYEAPESWKDVMPIYLGLETVNTAGNLIQQIDK